MSMIIKDSLGRVVIKTNNEGKIAIVRFPDMDDNFKNYIIELYKELTNGDPQKLRDFLDFKNEANEFCV